MGLIDAYKAMKSIDEIVCSMSVCINSDYCNGMRTMHDLALNVIENQPTVDAVQVVRCQKCKYYCGEETYTNHRICKIWNEETFANGWCYMGERRTE